MTDARIPVSLLTGFLGSGKTTLLNRLVRDPAMARALVVVNEFGSIGLDHHLLAAATDETVVEMASGCLCCTIRSDLARILRDAPWRFARDGRRWFDRVVIESTGLADPAPILHTLMTDAALLRLYRLDGVVTTVDAATGMATLDRQFESVRQAAVADRLVLTKTDLAEPAALDALERRLRALNPAAPLVRAAHGEVDPARLLEAGAFDPAMKSEDVRDWLDAAAYEVPHDHGHHHHDVNRHDDRIRAICLTVDEPIAEAAFERWLDLLALVKGPDMLRVKGIVHIAGFAGPMVLHAVQHIFHPPILLDSWPDDDRRTRMVFITRDIEERTLRETLALMTEAAGPLRLRGPADLDLDGWIAPAANSAVLPQP